MHARSSLRVGSAVVLVMAVALSVVFPLVSSAAPVPAATVAPAGPVSRTGIGNWQVLDERPQEFAFQYQGTGLPVQILVGVDPAGTVGFNVYTDAQWMALGAGDRTVKPVGRGTHDPFSVADLSWRSSSASGGLYHVQLFQITPAATRFWIAIAGPGAAGLNPMSPAVSSK
jgi:hypothetical protein